MYGATLEWTSVTSHGGIATGAAFLGARLGARMISKITMTQVQWIVACLLVILGIGVGSEFLG